MSQFTLFLTAGGGLLGVVVWAYNVFKAGHWFKFIGQHRMFLDSETEWWGYTLYNEYPIVMLCVNVLVGIALGLGASLMLPYLGALQ